MRTRSHVHHAEHCSLFTGRAPGAQPVPIVTRPVESGHDVVPGTRPTVPRGRPAGHRAGPRIRPARSLPFVSVPELSHTRSSPSKYPGKTRYPLHRTLPSLSTRRPLATSCPCGQSPTRASGRGWRPLEVLLRHVSLQACPRRLLVLPARLAPHPSSGPRPGPPSQDPGARPVPTPSLFPGN